MNAVKISLEKINGDMDSSPAEQKYRALMGQAQDLILVMELKEESSLEIIEANPAVGQAYGYSKSQLEGMNFCSALFGGEEGMCNDLVYQLLENKDLRLGLLTVSRSGAQVNIDATFNPVNIGSKKLVIFTAARATTKTVIYYGFRDKLTGLYNREYFEEELKRLNTERQLPLTIIIADMNGLKITNDAFGHKAGDKLLQQAAGVLISSCRKEDIVARWGGDEFAILLPNFSQAAAEILIDRIEKACLEQKTAPVRLSMAVGYATKKRSREHISTILKKAERNMYAHKVMERKNIYGKILDTLVDKLRQKNQESKSHIQFLEQLAREFGQRIDLPEPKIKDLMMLATIYDIGKITVPINILNKKDKLSSSEWELIKRHPETGYHISEPTPQIMNLADAILSHHERWDGSGYPQKLSGREIPLLARVIAIIDAYDAMVNGRPYRKPLSKQQALSELKKYAGIQFDPELVKKFIDLGSNN
ncbi:MAG: diguanylate cyclase [Actinomycetota bacterium]|nr:diguanylate cyclase [Actinomycetota bacterium]